MPRRDILPPHQSNRARLRFEVLEERANPVATVVNTLADSNDPNDGVLSLREAIAWVNGAPTTATG